MPFRTVLPSEVSPEKTTGCFELPAWGPPFNFYMETDEGFEPPRSEVAAHRVNQASPIRHKKRKARRGSNAPFQRTIY
jgi:hypothetical protein